MTVCGSAEILSLDETEGIEAEAFRLLADVGVRAEHETLVHAFLEGGAHTNGEVVLFPRPWMERFLEESQRVEEDFSSAFEYSAGAYPQYLLPPGTCDPQPHNLATMGAMVRLADRLPNIDIVYSGMSMPSDAPPRTIELHQRLLRWKYFKPYRHLLSRFRPHHNGPSMITEPGLCCYASEVGKIMSADQGGSARDYCYADTCLNSPLYFNRKEAELFCTLHGQGMHCDVGTVITLGGSGPVTVASALPLELAEVLFVNALQRAFYSERTLNFAAVLAPIDMRRGVFSYGRPELSLGILAMGQLARRRGALFNACSFFCDPSLPSAAAGWQKATSALSAVFAGSTGAGTCGLLSVDEVGSPDQLVIDAKYAGLLKSLARGTSLRDGASASELAARAGHGGNFLVEPHTTEHCRQLWEPGLLGSTVEPELARELWEQALHYSERRYIREDTEKALREVIRRAEREP
jgi:trimethylamine:corrinoid methyltransferase-like protein